MYYQLDRLNTRIIGSVHAFPPTVTLPPGWIRRAYEWSREIYLEHDLSDFIPRFQAAYQGGESWALMLTNLVSGVSLNPGVESLLIAWRAQDSRPDIRYLETAQSVIDRWKQVPAPDLIRAHELANVSAQEKQWHLEALYRAWAAGSVVEAHAVARRSPLSAVESLRRATLVDRNESWAPEIANLGTSDVPRLIVVGCLHLSGPDSLLLALEERGLTITPLAL